MEYLLILLLCFLASAKVVLQSKFAKDQLNGKMDAVFFNGLIFAVAALVSLWGLRQGVSLKTFSASCIFGLSSVLFQLFYVYSLSLGPVSITGLIINCSMIVPILLSTIVYKEELTILRSCGIVLTLVSFCLNADNNDECRIHKKWLCYVVAAFLANSCSVIVQKIYTKVSDGKEYSQFVAVAYLVATVISFVMCFVMRKKGANCSFAEKRQMYVLAGVIGCLLAVFQIINTYVTTTVKGTVLYPLYNGGTVLLVTVSGILLFRERLSKKQYIGIVIGIVAIVVMR